MKKILIVLCLILMVGCTTTRQAYLPHTSRVFHAKKNCVGCYDPNPIVFQSVQAAANSSGIAPCRLCVKPKSLSVKNQGYTATNYATSGSSTGGSNSQKLPPAKSKSSVVARVLAGVFVTLGLVAIAASTGATPSVPNTTFQPTYSGSSSGGYSSPAYNTPSSVFNTTTPSYSSSGTSSRIGNTTYHDYSNGLTGTSSRIGNTTYHDYSDGTTGTSSRIGNTTYHDFSDGTTGTSSNIGGTTYHDYSDGTTGTSSRIGNTTYHDFSDGTTGTSSNIGGTTYHNYSGN